jgi:hypothetical protein
LSPVSRRDGFEIQRDGDYRFAGFVLVARQNAIIRAITHQIA